MADTTCPASAAAVHAQRRDGEAAAVSLDMQSAATGPPHDHKDSSTLLGEQSRSTVESQSVQEQQVGQNIGPSCPPQHVAPSSYPRVLSRIRGELEQAKSRIGSALEALMSTAREACQDVDARESARVFFGYSSHGGSSDIELSPNSSPTKPATGTSPVRGGAQGVLPASGCAQGSKRARVRRRTLLVVSLSSTLLVYCLYLAIVSRDYYTRRGGLRLEWPKRAEVEEHSPEIAALLDKVVVGQSIHPVTGLMSPGTPDGGGVVGGDLAAGSLSMLPLSAGPGTGVHGVHDAVVHGDEAAVVVEEEDAADPDLIFPLMEDPLGPAAVQQQQQQLGDAEGSREYSYIFAAPDDANVAEMKRLEKHGGKGKGKGKGKGDYGVDAEQVPSWLDDIRSDGADRKKMHTLAFSTSGPVSARASPCKGFPDPPPMEPMYGRIFPGANLVDYTAYVLKALDAENVTYILEGGGLLGAYRHGGFIPGDKDVDVLIPYWLNAHMVEERAPELSAGSGSCPELRTPPDTEDTLKRVRLGLCGRDWQWWTYEFWPRALQSLLAKYGVQIKTHFQMSLYDQAGHRLAHVDFVTNPRRLARYSPRLPLLMAETPCRCRFGSIQAMCPAHSKAALREQFGPKFMTPDRNLQDKKSWLADEWGAQNVKNIDAWRQSHASRPK